ncbi:MAG: hypothetical protein Q8N81_03790 [bacterium]|nr:hypothetical protein [bacterium]
MNQISNNTPLFPAQQPLPQMPPEEPPKKNYKTWTRLAIVIVIVAGAIIYARYQENKKSELINAPSPAAVMEALQKSETSGKQPQLKVIDKVSDENQNPQEVRTENDKIIVTAQPGEGYTHLARRALAQYLKTTGAQDLQAEHKIFIEDYLQKKIENKPGVKVGAEVGFSQDQIQQAIDQALALGAAQLDNLHKYVQLVPSLK